MADTADDEDSAEVEAGHLVAQGHSHDKFVHLAALGDEVHVAAGAAAAVELDVEAAGAAAAGVVVGAVEVAVDDELVAVAVVAVAVAGTAAGSVSAHGPAMQSVLHELHEQRDHRACFCQQERQEAETQLEIDLEGERCLVLACPRSKTMAGVLW